MEAQESDPDLGSDRNSDVDLIPPEETKAGFDDYKCPYSDEQMQKYFERIKLPEDMANENRAPIEAVTQLDVGSQYLDQIHHRHLAAIPFENLGLHYSKDPRISLEPQAVYEKLVVRRRGGYCMEHNLLLLHVLRTFGFTVWPTGARVRSRVHGVPAGTYGGWTHVVLIVDLGHGRKWMVDAGFGGDCPLFPVALLNDLEDHSEPNIGAQRSRCVPYAGQSTSEKANQLWIYQTQENRDATWQSQYCFSELEFFPQDFDLVSYFVDTSPQSYLTRSVVVVGYVMDDEDGIEAKKILRDSTVTRQGGGSKQTTREQLYILHSEAERLEVLEIEFGLRLTVEEIDAIKGKSTEVRQDV